MGASGWVGVMQNPSPHSGMRPMAECARWLTCSRPASLVEAAAFNAFMSRCSRLASAIAAETSGSCSDPPAHPGGLEVVVFCWRSHVREVWRLG